MEKAQEGFRTSLGGGPQAASVARQAVSRLRSDLDDPLLENARLLVTELVTNSVRHAGAEQIELACSVGPERVRFEVSNPGGTFTAPKREAGDVDESGWGLFLVDRLTDRWGVIEDGGIARVWFELLRA